jgi:hypothetical protein
LERADSRNAEPVDPVIGTPHLSHCIVECELLTGTRSAKDIMASGHVSRNQKPDTWLPRPTLLLQRSLTPGAVHTWRLGKRKPLLRPRFEIQL